MAKNKYLQIGTVRKSDDGRQYLKFHQVKDRNGNYTSEHLEKFIDVLNDSGSKGVSVNIERIDAKLRKLNELGYIDDDQLVSRLEAVPDYMVAELTIAVPNDE